MSSEVATLKTPTNRYEAERGKPMPSLNHAAVQANLIAQFMPQRDYRIVSELTLRLAGEDYTPDISVYPAQPLDFRRDRVKMQEPPLAAVEIFSPSQGSQDVMNKLEVYFAHGVKSCWVVAPPLRSITIYTADGQQTGFTTGVAKDPVTGLTADLGAVFA